MPTATRPVRNTWKSLGRIALVRQHGAGREHLVATATREEIEVLRRHVGEELVLAEQVADRTLRHGGRLAVLRPA